jgi:iron complex transport system ATP-binding protein
MRLSIENLSCGYGRGPVVDSLSLDLGPGEILCVLGPNGSGKTTLLKALLGFLRAVSGRIAVDGEDISGWPPRRRAAAIAYVPQSHTPPFPFTAREVVAMGRTCRSSSLSGPSRGDMAAVEEALAEMGIGGLGDRPYTELSGGERQLVLLARAIAQESPILTLDEPTANLDLGNQAKVLGRVTELAARGSSVIMTTHSPDHAFLCAAGVVLMSPGAPARIGSAEQTITGESIRRTYGVEVLLADVVDGRGGRARACVPSIASALPASDGASLPEDLEKAWSGPAEELFARAGALAAAKRTVYCSPDLLDAACSTYPPCRHCRWEHFRIADPAFVRPRTVEEFVEKGRALARAGIDRIFMPAGWMGLDPPEERFAFAEALRRAVDVKLYALWGSLSRDALSRLADIGIDGVFCGLESPNPAVYRRFRPGGDGPEDRLRTLEWAREAALELWTGFIVGLGEDEGDIARGVSTLASISPQAVSIVPFLPAPGTALRGAQPANPWRWARAMALAAVALPGADHFCDQVSGYLEPYGRLGGANGFFKSPASAGGGIQIGKQ